MGDRANYVVVQDGRWELFYSHWGAISVELDLLAGPNPATRFIRAQRAVDLNTDGWLDDVWCEGAALVDHDRRRLCFYTLHFNGYARRAAVLAVLARTWPGWTIDWAYDGLADLVAHLGQDRAIVRFEQDPLELTAGEDDWVSCLLTVTGDGEPRAYALGLEAAGIMDHGQAILGMLPDEARCTRCDVLPDSGIHLDLSTRSAGVWTLPPLTGALSRTDRLWPGWRWEMWADRHTEQPARFDGRIALPDLDLRAALEELRAEYQEHPADNPAERAKVILEEIAAGDGSAIASPYFFDHELTPPAGTERSPVLTAITTLIQSVRPIT